MTHRTIRDIAIIAAIAALVAANSVAGAVPL